MDLEFYKCTVYICINYLSTPLSIKPKFKCFRCFVVFGIIYQLVDNDETVAQVRENFVLKHLLIHSFVCGSFIHSSIHPFIDSAFFLTKSILHPISHQLQNYIFWGVSFVCSFIHPFICSFCFLPNLGPYLSPSAWKITFSEGCHSFVHSSIHSVFYQVWAHSFLPHTGKSQFSEVHILIQVTKDVIEEFADDNVKYLELRSTPRANPAKGIWNIKYRYIVTRWYQVLLGWTVRGEGNAKRVWNSRHTTVQDELQDRTDLLTTQHAINTFYKNKFLK